MKYEDTVFDDGTEPTVRQVPERRLPYGCDQQGRYPEAAEAATDIGQDDDLNAFDWVALLMLAVAVAVTVVVGALTLLGGGV
jgi:hypothetical protein